MRIVKLILIIIQRHIIVFAILCSILFPFLHVVRMFFMYASTYYFCFLNQRIYIYIYIYRSREMIIY